MAMLHSPPATTPTQSTTSRRRSVSLRTTTSSTPTDHPPTPPPESSPRPFPTPRRPSRSSSTGPRATTIASAPPTRGSAATMTPSRRTRMASKLTQQRGPQVRPRRRRVRRFPDSLHLALRRRLCWENPSTLNRHLKDPRIMQVLGVLLNVKLWRPNSAEDADIPDAEMTEEEPEPEDMDVPEEEREARERKKEAHKEKEKGNAAYKKKDFEAAIQHYAKAIELDDKDISFLTNRAVVYLEMGQSSDVFEQEQNVIASRKITRSNEKDHEGGSERAREKARKMLLLLRGRDEAAAAEEDEAFEGGPSRARHRVGRNSGPIYIDLEFRRVRARTKRDCTEKDHKVERERSRQPRRRRRCLREDRVGFGTESVGTRMVLTPLMVPSTGRFQAPVGAVCRCVEQINIMTQFGYYCFYRCLSVPPGFTISTEACQEYQQNGKKLPDGLWDQILEGLETVQKDMGAFLGDPSRPLLLSVRSGAAIRPLFEEDGNVVEVALIKDKRTGQQQGLKHESRNQELLDGARRCVEQINKASCGDLSPKELKEREVKAIQDPEIQSILTDPVMSQVLIDFDENPKAALEHAKNPVVMNKKCQHWDDNPAIMAVGVVDGTSEAVFRTVMSLVFGNKIALLVMHVVLLVYVDTYQPRMSTASGFVRKLHDLAVQKKVGYMDLQEVAWEENVSCCYGATLAKDPGCNLPCSWTTADPSTFLIRGESYLQALQKTKARSTLLQMVAADWIRSDKREDDLGSHPGGIVQKYAANGGLEFFLIVNMQIPGSTTYGLALYFMTKTPLEETPILERFVNGDDAYRNSRFKLIPYISKGSWIVKQSVGKKACLVGQALEVKYNRGKNYLELGINVGSTTVARG
ncbi:pleckstrin homology (PH) and lipid-binding START domains-containing protein [Actinidia rufa]|uniref:Pleckstrin homology (PH) and lipid-binding START domains-containing protein n=1 Tax=Actinidia rufa TaxID=165716 RepID=A0A7J0EFC2_9ERIC|nr:pleckstrin homology (PH) and lipid-binding START domains-containing protein [Actinidia rufa]